MVHQPTHWEDQHKLDVRARAGVAFVSTVDLLRVIQAMDEADIREGYVKTESYEVKVRK